MNGRLGLSLLFTLVIFHWSRTRAQSIYIDGTKRKETRMQSLAVHRLA